MFYSQIILAKKGPLGHLWMAAHFQDRKLSRAQIFATDIGASVESIVHPAVPLALRVSGHLLLGVVRIYSKKVQYLWQDCHQAMVQIQMAFIPQSSKAINQTITADDDMAADAENAEDGGGKEPSRRRRRTRDKDVHEAEETDVGSIPAAFAMQGFGIPFDLNEDEDDNADWAPSDAMGQDGNPAAAEAAAALGLPTSPDQTQEHSPNQPLSKARAAADLTLHSLEDDFYSESGGHRSSLAASREEQWTAFDPDDGEEEEDAPIPMMDEEDAPLPPAGDDDNQTPLPPDTSDHSSLEVEIPRANQSVESDPRSSGRPSSLLLSIGTDESKEKDGKKRISEAEFSLENDLSDIPLLNDDENDINPELAENGNHASLTLEEPFPSPLKERDGSSIAAVSLGDGSGDDAPVVDEDQDYLNQKRKSSSGSVQKARKRKRRKIWSTDDEQIELTSDEIRQMLRHTEDLFTIPPPIVPEAVERQRSSSDSESSAAEGTEFKPSDFVGLSSYNLDPTIINFLSYEKLFDRPALADEGGASPEMLGVWERTAKLRDEVARETASRVTLEKETNVDKKQDGDGQGHTNEDEVEVARRGKNNDMDATSVPGIDDDEPMMELPQDDDEEVPFPSIEEEEEAPILADDEEPPLDVPEEDIDMDESDEKLGNSNSKSSLDLGLVNSLGEDMQWDGEEQEEDERQEAGDEIVSSNSKWHKHTLKVYSLLKSRMAPVGTLNAETEEKEPHLSYNALSEGCSRRTAVGVFFELLQLKTWDFIEVDQDTPYGDIVISPGVKFAESAPTS